MFEKSLQDLIRGLRKHKLNEQEFVAKCLLEIQNEIKSSDIDIKALAVSKLFYLNMLGYDMQWAAFHVIEIMSNSRIEIKRLGYMTAAASFNQNTNVLMLCTNLIKKDLSSKDSSETSIALHALSLIVTPELARDLFQDVMILLNHSKSYLRKRAILVLYRMYIKYPESLRISFPKLKARLQDESPSVVAAAVSVLCELATRNPKSYLPLAPDFYKLLTEHQNNWMLIKIVKLFAALSELEPRLVKKLIEPLCQLLETTKAMSLVYECIQTLIKGNMIPLLHQEPSQQDLRAMNLIIQKLKLLVNHPDPNLKSLGLYNLSCLVKIRPDVMGHYTECVLHALEDVDITIRLQALEIVHEMVCFEQLKYNSNLIQKVNGHNLNEIIQKLLMYVVEDNPLSHSLQELSGIQPDDSYRSTVAHCILNIIDKNTFEYVSDFEWILSTLIELAFVPGLDLGSRLSDMIINLNVYVRDIRPFTIHALSKIFHEMHVYNELKCIEVMYAAAWIIGEYPQHVQDPQSTFLQLISPSLISHLSASTQSVCLLASFKVFSHWLGQDTVSCTLVQDLYNYQSLLREYESSPWIEVCERAAYLIQIIILLIQDYETSLDKKQTLVQLYYAVASLFEGELNPVASNAQSMVPIPSGLDLHNWIGEPIPDPFISLYESLEPEPPKDKLQIKVQKGKTKKPSEDPFYISNADAQLDSMIESIPIVPIPMVESQVKSFTPSSIFQNVMKSDGKLYQVSKNVELPVGFIDSAVKLEKGKKEIVDADTLAIRAVDLTLEDEYNPIDGSTVTSKIKSKSLDKSVEKSLDKVKKKKKKVKKSTNSATFIENE